MRCYSSTHACARSLHTYNTNHLLSNHEADKTCTKPDDEPKDKPELEPDGQPAQRNACDRLPNHHGACELLTGWQGEDTRKLQLC